jgi:hypothetical protein
LSGLEEDDSDAEDHAAGPTYMEEQEQYRHAFLQVSE